MFGETHEEVEKNPYAKFRRNSSTGYGGDAITGKIQDDRRRPYLATDRTQIRAGITRTFGEHPKQVKKKI